MEEELRKAKRREKGRKQERDAYTLQRQRERIEIGRKGR